MYFVAITSAWLKDEVDEQVLSVTLKTAGLVNLTTETVEELQVLHGKGCGWGLFFICRNENQGQLKNRNIAPFCNIPFYDTPFVTPPLEKSLD